MRRVPTRRERTAYWRLAGASTGGKVGNMFKHYRFRRAGAALALIGLSVLAAPVAAPSAGAATNRPHVIGCTPGEEFLKSSQSQEFYGTGQTAWYYNANAKATSKSLSTSTTNSVAYSIGSSQSVDAGVIFASADVSFSEGVTYTHNDTSTQTTTVSDIPPGKYGIIQIGNQFGIVKGTYEVINSTCQTTESTSVTGAFPLNEAVGSGTAVESSPTPPWPEAKVS